LAKVGVLRVIDRQALSAAMRADGMAAPRFGDPEAHRRAARAAGAGRVVAGSLQMRDASELKLYGGIADAQAGRFDDLDPVATSLERFFELQKDFLWALLDSMDLAVSPDEQAAIERNQTQSLPAFLAFCRGLAYEDQELSDAAAREYRIAVEQDGEFAAARARLAGDPLAAGAADAVETLGLAGLEAAVLAEPEALPVASDQDQILADLAARWGIVRDADPVAQPADAPEWIPGVTITIQGEPDGRR